MDPQKFLPQGAVSTKASDNRGRHAGTNIHRFCVTQTTEIQSFRDRRQSQGILRSFNRAQVVT